MHKELEEDCEVARETLGDEGRIRGDEGESRKVEN